MCASERETNMDDDDDDDNPSEVPIPLDRHSVYILLSLSIRPPVSSRSKSKSKAKNCNIIRTYIGCTKNFKKRIQQHNGGYGSTYTSGRLWIPIAIIQRQDPTLKPSSNKSPELSLEHALKKHNKTDGTRFESTLYPGSSGSSGYGTYTRASTMQDPTGLIIKKMIQIRDTFTDGKNLHPHLIRRYPWHVYWIFNNVFTQDMIRRSKELYGPGREYDWPLDSCVENYPVQLKHLKIKSAPYVWR